MKIKTLSIFIAVFAVHVLIGGATWVITRQSSGEFKAGEAQSVDDISRTSSEISTTSPSTSESRVDQVVNQARTPTMNSGKTKIYIVKSGDRLSVIAGRYGVSVKKLMEFNKIANINKIFIGQKIKIPLN
jgi:LysM repeat protein